MPEESKLSSVEGHCRCVCGLKPVHACWERHAVSRTAARYMSTSIPQAH